MYKKVYNIDGHQAYTLGPEDLGEHESGWAITGDVQEDYYRWVNEFEAIHPKYGKVYGDFETVVYAESEEALEHFIKHHPPEYWDYYDI